MAEPEMWDEPGPRLMRELEDVAAAAQALEDAVRGANALDETFPREKVADLTKSLKGLVRGTAEGCGETLYSAVEQLSGVRFSHVPREGESDKPTPNRDGALDGAFSKLLTAIMTAQAARNEQLQDTPPPRGNDRTSIALSPETRAELRQQLGADEAQTRAAADRLDEATGPEARTRLARLLNDVANLAAATSAALWEARVPRDLLRRAGAVLVAWKPRISKAAKITLAIGGSVFALGAWLAAFGGGVTIGAIGGCILATGAALKQIADALPDQKPSSEPAHHLAENPPTRNREPSYIVRPVDEPWCPELVMLPAGSFRMGARDGEFRARADQKPRHEVSFARPFALGRTPVTFAQFDHFCDATGRKKPRDERWGRGDRPVINVSWHDAQEYLAWLTCETGSPWRLPSEAEWEYGCRAESETAYSFGDEPDPHLMNFGDNFGKTTAVDDYPANPWSLNDMHGNVWEWCEDPWHNDYSGAPVDGSAWLEDGGAGRVVRGGSWRSVARFVRSAFRNRYEPDDRRLSIGFRCARAHV